MLRAGRAGERIHLELNTELMSAKAAVDLEMTVADKYLPPRSDC